MFEKPIEIFANSGDITKKVKPFVDWSINRNEASNEKQDAFRNGAKMKIEEVDVKIKELTEEINSLEDGMVVIEDEIWNIESKGEDPSLKKQELVRAEEKIRKNREEIKLASEQKEDLVKVTGEYQEKLMTPELRNKYLNEIIYPFVDGLGSIKAFATRVTIDKHKDVFNARLIAEIK